MGHIITQNIIQPDEKNKCYKNMPIPKNKADALAGITNRFNVVALI